MSLGLLIQIPLISAQEELSADALYEDVDVTEALTREEEIREAELAITFGDAAGDVLPPAGPTMWTVVRMILVLAVVAAAIYGIIFLFKRAGKQKTENNPYLKILANTHLGLNRYAHIVSVGGKAWLIGASEGGVTLIDKIEDQEIIDAMLLEDSRESELSTNRLPDFMTLLGKLGVRPTGQTPGAGNLRKYRERLNKGI